MGTTKADKKTLKRPGRLSFALMCLLLAFTLTVNVISIGFFRNVITMFFDDITSSISDTSEAVEASARAGEFVETLAGEGIVLLENNGALPLDQVDEKQKRVNVFGWSSVSPVYVGSGSGVGSDAKNTTMQEGLQKAGFEVNDELTQLYINAGFERKAYNSFGRFGVDYHKHEIAAKDYPEEVLTNAKDFSDVAIIMISRMGGELSLDLPLDMSEYGGRSDEHYLELGDKERDMIEMVKEMDFEKVIVVINSSHPMELGFLEEDGIDAAVWIGGPGQNGMTAMAKILSGEINPSGRLVDTYAYDQTSAPSFQNFGDFVYTGTEGVGVYNWGEEVHNKSHSYVDYAEGIYIGYRYYETRWVDNATGQIDEGAYRDAVLYPFGYGLSYTTFEQKIVGYEADQDIITVSVEVTNTGSATGKDVVQIYYTPPYTIGGIEKSHVVLAEFGKTGQLEPGASETLELTFDVVDMASYDYQWNKAYVLEEGTYGIKLMNNAHDVIDQREYEVASTIIYDEDNKRPSDMIAATNQFDDVTSDIQYLSRADWEGTWPYNVPRERMPSEEILEILNNVDPPVDPDAPDIVIKDNGLKLKDMIGLDYDDPKWDLILQQLSVEDMQLLVGTSGFAMQALESVGMPYSTDVDGPAGLRNPFISSVTENAAQYCSQVLIASTWNQELVEEMGRIYGNEAVSWEVTGLYGPIVNLHRSPFANRNYEFYSEDAILSGKIATAFTRGFQENGAVVFIKHFALYEQSTNQLYVSTFCNEQAFREIYLRPFEMVFKEGGAKAAMNTYNRVGNVWSGGNYALLTTVLREEWGFQGMVVTDAVNNPAMQNPNQAMHAGTDGMLSTVTIAPTDLSNAGKQAMRRACKNIMYTVANSVAMEFGDYGPQPYWMYIMFGVDAVILALAICYFIRRNRKIKIWKAEHDAYAAVKQDNPDSNIHA